MKRTNLLVKLCCVVLAVCMCLGMTACSGSKTDAENIQDKGTLVVGVTIYEPIDYQDENGEWIGFDAEFAKAVAEKLGVEAEFVVIDWDNKFFELESGAIDCIWNGMTITDEVIANADASAPYAINGQVVVMDSAEVGNYKDAASMADLQFAAEAGSAGAAALADNGITKVTEVATQADALLEVASGSADACIVDITMANAMTGEGTSYASLGYEFQMTREEYGVAFRKGSDMLAKVDELIAAMKADGSLQALADKYNMTLAE